MIVRKLPDGSLLLISQNDHAKLSGYFAAHWGNEQFARPRPFESVVRGTTFHDFGWSRYDTGPLYDPAKKATPTFFQVPLSDEQLEAFQWGVDWLTKIDPYAGLMSNRHRTGLWRGRYGAFAHPAPPPSHDPGPGVAAFLARNEPLQEQQLYRIDRGAFEINYRLLQVWDILSLYFCTGDPRPEHFDVVPTGYAEADQAGVRMTLTPAVDRRVEIHPYPFDIQPLAVNIICKRLATADYPDEAAFREAFFGAPPEVLHLELVKRA